MIKHKGVCDVCTAEFELGKGSFAIRMVEDDLHRSRKKWTITVLDIDNTPEDGFFHVCGVACLYEAITEVIGKRTEGCKFRTIAYDDTYDSKARVLDLTDKMVK
jgi:hypothetical protein